MIPIWAIVLIVLGGLAGVLLVVLGIVLWQQKRSQRKALEARKKLTEMIECEPSRRPPHASPLLCPPLFSSPLLSSPLQSSLLLSSSLHSSPHRSPLYWNPSPPPIPQHKARSACWMQPLVE